jgi:hypothetical protein
MRHGQATSDWKIQEQMKAAPNNNGIPPLHYTTNNVYISKPFAVISIFSQLSEFKQAIAQIIHQFTQHTSPSTSLALPHLNSEPKSVSSRKM